MCLTTPQEAAHPVYAIPVFRDAFEARKLTLYWAPVDYELLKKHPDAKRPPD